MKLKSLLPLIIFLYVIFAQTHVAVCQGVSATPELPERFDTTYPSPPTGPTICVGGPNCAQQSLQAAINQAALHNEGATVEIDSTATFTGTITLPNRPADSGWIIIRTSNMAGMPNAEERVFPTHASAMPRIIVPDDRAAIVAAIGTSATNNPNHYRLVGLEIELADSFPSNINHTSGLVRLGKNDETNLDLSATRVIIDRCYIHGRDDRKVKRGVELNGKYNAVVDSYLSTFIGPGGAFETNAIYGQRGGPSKIMNNYLEATDINLLFNGDSSAASERNPINIEIQHNHFFKPLSWRNVSPYYRVKNLFELKGASKVLVNGNIFENNWTTPPPPGDQSNMYDDYQSGAAILVKPNGPAITENVTFTNNIVRHSQHGISIFGGENAPIVNRVKIENVLIYDLQDLSPHVDPQPFGRTYRVYGAATDVQIIHTTAEGKLFIVDTFVANNADFTFRDNIVERGATGIKGEGYVEGTATLNQFFNPYAYLKNLLVNNSEGTAQPVDDATLLSRYPSPCPSSNQACTSGQTFVASGWGSVGFTSGGDDPAQRHATGNYSLASNSPYANQASDKTTSTYKDIGINQGALDAETSGVISGIWTSGEGDVTWVNPVNATAVGSTLTKKAPGTHNVWNAGASSLQSIQSGEGYLEFSPGEASTGKVCGLNTDAAASVGYASIDFAIALGANNTFRVYESGSLKGIFGSYVSTDRFRIAIEGTTVKYYQNYAPGVSPFYTSLVTLDSSLNYPLYADASLYTLTPTPASITNVRLSLSSSPGTLTWQNMAGVGITNNTLTKTFTTTAWDAGASSVQALSGGNGYVEFTATETTGVRACGLNTIDANKTLHDIDYAIFLNGNATASLRIYEKGLLQVTVGTYLVGDKFRVAIEGGNVNYYRIRNGVVTSLHSSAAPGVPVVVDTSLNTPGAKISNVTISGAWSD